MYRKMTDKEIRAAVKSREFNGYYATKICKCGEFWASPDGHTNTAKIVEVCKKCFEEGEKC